MFRPTVFSVTTHSELIWLWMVLFLSLWWTPDSVSLHTSWFYQDNGGKQVDTHVWYYWQKHKSWFQWLLFCPHWPSTTCAWPNRKKGPKDRWHKKILNASMAVSNNRAMLFLAEGTVQCLHPYISHAWARNVLLDTLLTSLWKIYLPY